MKGMKEVLRAKASEKAKGYASGGVVKEKLAVDNGGAPKTNRGSASNKAEGGIVDGGRARMRPDRSARKGGKGKTNVNVIVAPTREAPAQTAPPASPPMAPRAATPPPPAPPLPPAPMPVASVPPIPGQPPLLRKRGGKVKC